MSNLSGEFYDMTIRRHLNAYLKSLPGTQNCGFKGENVPIVSVALYNWGLQNEAAKLEFEPASHSCVDNGSYQ